MTPVYVAGGYVDRATAAEVASLLIAQGCRITYPWWDVPEDVPEARKAVAELYAIIDDSDIVVVLDAHAGYGTAGELGMALAVDDDDRVVVWVTLADTEPRLAWFGPLAEVRVVVPTWDAAVIAEAVAIAVLR